MLILRASCAVPGTGVEAPDPSSARYQQINPKHFRWSGHPVAPKIVQPSPSNQPLLQMRRRLTGSLSAKELRLKLLGSRRHYVSILDFAGYSRKDKDEG